MKEILYTLVALDVLVSLASLFYFPKWWLRIWDVSHPYLLLFNLLLLAAVLVLLGGWAWSKIAMIIVLGLMTVVHAWKILPYTPFYPKEVQAQSPTTNSFTFLSINVLKTNTNYGAFQQLIEKWQPDLVLVIEYTPEWAMHLADLLQAYPYQRAQPREDGFGLAFFSKMKLTQAEMIYPVDKETPLIHTLLHLPSDTISVLGAHPKPPVPWMKNATEKKDVATAILAKIIQEAPHPVLVAGDFNDVSWSTLMQAFKSESELQDPRVGRGFYNTYHARKWYIRYPIDHIFLDKRFRLSQFQTVRLPGSDHFGLFIEIQL